MAKMMWVVGICAIALSGGCAATSTTEMRLSCHSYTPAPQEHWEYYTLKTPLYRDALNYVGPPARLSVWWELRDDSGELIGASTPVVAELCAPAPRLLLDDSDPQPATKTRQAVFLAMSQELECQAPCDKLKLTLQLDHSFVTKRVELPAMVYAGGTGWNEFGSVDFGSGRPDCVLSCYYGAAPDTPTKDSSVIANVMVRVEPIAQEEIAYSNSTLPFHDKNEPGVYP